MQKITDRKTIDSMIAGSMISTYFDPGHLDELSFECAVYEDGELIQSPLKPLESFLFIMEGNARIYGIREDGTAASVTIAGRGRILGDLEYTSPRNRSIMLYTEAVGRTVCLMLSFERSGRILSRDITFMNILLRSIADKLHMFIFTRAEHLTLEERTMQLIERQKGDIKGVTAAAMTLGCSRRHLQRILKKLCEEKKIKRTGRGRYLLI
ncbi:MAG: Crp/Fnr family transcriptional regulator [Lachnospiraceae bacterium]|nr:Crp/Fnr family transcriptional regulator [Lachnospiraceae bacterium]